MSSDNIVPIGFNYNGFKVLPSEKIYYSEFPYKINFKGNIIHRDIKEHEKLDDILYRGYNWSYTQSTYTNKHRVVYFRDLDKIDQILQDMPHLVEQLYGPIDTAHAEYISNPFAEDVFQHVYREKFWYNKYDVKIDIRSRDVYSWSNSSSADLEKPANDFVDFIKQQSFDYVLYLDNDSKYWANNYLYLKSEDLSEIQPWISMLYSEVVEKINSAVIYPTDK